MTSFFRLKAGFWQESPPTMLKCALLFASAGVAAAAMPIPGAIAASVSVVYSFKARTDGAYPDALIELGNAFYGTTFNGGGNSTGTVFQLTPQGKETILHTFGPIGQGDGRLPAGGVIGVNGTLYGTTEDGGTADTGTVFALTQQGVETVLHSFTGGPDGAVLIAGLLNVGGALYGVTVGGGEFSGSHCRGGCGTVFKITTDGKEQLIHAFAGGTQDGASPYAPLIHSDGAFYGVTVSGGKYGYGTVFKLTDSGVESVLYSFKGSPSDGARPVGALAELGGDLYGTTENGGIVPCSGSPGCGVVFKVTKAGVETVLHRFSSGSGDGYHPINGLNIVQSTLSNVPSILYGTTDVGGATNNGVLYSITPTGKQTILASFRGKRSVTGANQQLVDFGGALWGTSFYGGTSCVPEGGCGTVYKVTR